MKLITDLHILNTTLSTETNTVEMSLGDAVSGETEYDGAQLIQQVGFCSLPPKPIAGKSSADAIIYRTDNRDFVIATRHVDSQNNYGRLIEGETSIYASGPNGTGQARVMLKADGSVNLYTTNTNDATGTGVYFQVSPTAFVMMAPWGKFVFDATGLHITHASGASIRMGALAVPGPLSALGSYCRITAATTTLDSSAVFLGPPGPFLPATTSALAGVPSPPFSQTGSSSVFIGV